MSMTITSSRKDKLTQIGCFTGGHTEQILSIGTLVAYPDKIMTASRDKTMLLWNLKRYPDFESDGIIGTPLRRYTGHSHFVTAVNGSADSKFAITSSWDKTLRLWDLESGKATHLFKGHTGDILCSGISNDNRTVCSGGRDKTLKSWNVCGQCMNTMTGHEDWVSSVILSPTSPTCFTASWDSKIKMTSLKTFEVKTLGGGGKGSPIVSMEISPDSSLCAIGTKDNMLILWDLEVYNKIWSIGMPAEVRSIVFAPHSYQLCAAVNSTIYVYDLINKVLVDECTSEASSTSSASTGNQSKPEILCMKWSTDGNTLFAGYTNGEVRAWKFVPTNTIKVNQDK